MVYVSLKVLSRNPDIYYAIVVLSVCIRREGT